ncbi:MAG: hypothetical protein JRJ59_05495 [Deltaproteobacteria bacterium]|nr:hypothetical protein [Deltaproteobacteria bacterium]
MDLPREIGDLSQIIGRRILIVGEVNSGKTALTGRLLEEVVQAGLGGRVLIVDLAPVIHPEVAAKKGFTGLGGQLQPPQEADCICLRTALAPPRMATKTEEEALSLAEINRRAIETMWAEVGRAGRDILFVNDLSLYLQAGRSSTLIESFKLVKTVVANGYYGQALGQGVLSRRERAEMEALMEFFDRTIRL